MITRLYTIVSVMVTVVCDDKFIKCRQQIICKCMELMALPIIEMYAFQYLLQVLTVFNVRFHGFGHVIGNADKVV